MKLRFCLLLLAVAAFPIGLLGQNRVGALPNSDAVAGISADLSRIAKSVQTLNDQIKVFIDKAGAPTAGAMVNEKQQKIITGIQALAAQEQRVANLQYSQIEFTVKLNESRSRLIQVESDLRPRNIDRSVAFEGTTETEELRESRRQRLQAERTTLTQLVTQLQTTLAETNDILRAAQLLATRMRQRYLPQIEAEMQSQ